MNDLDRMSPSEQRLRAELHRVLAPPPTPFRLLAHVEDLAAGSLDEPAPRRSPLKEAITMGGRTLRLGLAMAAVLVLVIAAGVLVGSRIEESQVVETPHPTLPAFTGPALPSPAPNPTLVTEGAWVDASTAWLVDVDQRLRITTDGAQTWSEPRELPFTETGLEFVDAEHGFTTWAAQADGVGPLLAWRTSDGGRSWQSGVVGTVARATGESLLATVNFFDRVHGVALVATVVEAQVEFHTCTGFGTDDGGVSWTQLPAAPCFLSMSWAGPRLGVVLPVSGSGEAQLTTDGGRTWRKGTLPGVGGGTEFWQQAVVDAGQGRVRLVGTYHRDEAAGTPPLVVLETSDDGATWHEAHRSSLPDAGITRWLTAFDADHWLAVVGVIIEQRPFQATELQETWDGGRTWALAPGTGTIDASWASWGDRLHGMLQGVDMGDCSNPDTSCGGDGTMFLTNDGGRTWHLVPF